MSEESTQTATRRRGRPAADKAVDEAAAAMAATSLHWVKDALDRVRQAPDLNASAAVLRVLDNDDARRVVGDALLSHLVPVYPDLETWTAWASGGDRSPNKRGWIAHARVGGQSRARRDMSRMMVSAARFDDEAERWRDEAAKLTARADAAADSAEACRDQGRAFAVMLLDISLQSSIEQAYAMGAGWVVLKAIAKTGRGRVVLAKLDAGNDDIDFMDDLGQSIAGAVDRHVEATEKLSAQRVGMDGDRMKSHLNSLPDSVDAAEILAVLRELIPAVEKRSGAPLASPAAGDTEDDEGPGIFDVSEPAALQSVIWSAEQIELSAGDEGAGVFDSSGWEEARPLLTEMHTDIVDPSLDDPNYSAM